MKLQALGLASLAAALLAPAAWGGSPTPTTPSTKQLAGTPCSASVTFTRDQFTRTMSYGGRVRCTGSSASEKTLDVVPQVYNVVHGKPLWFDISLIGRYQGPTPVNPLLLSGAAPYVPSHTYRVLAYGAVTLNSGHSASATVCSGACVGAPALSIRSSYTFLAQPPTSIMVTGMPCVVGQTGLMFTLVNGSYVIDYGGYSLCAGPSPSNRSITICAQVVNRIHGRDRWFTVTGSCLSRPPTQGRAALSTAGTAYLGHGYRVSVASTIHYPTAHGAVTRTATAYSAVSGP